MNPVSWSTDGRFITYKTVGSKGYSEVWVLPQFPERAGGDRKPFPFLQSEEFTQSSPKFSPDGRWLVYQSNESGRYEVYIQSFPKRAGKWQVSTGGGDRPRWSRDGKELFYLAPDQRLMAVAVKGDSAPEVGAPRPLFETRMFGGVRATVGFRQQYDVAPDSQRFLINVPVAEEASSPITLVLNWAAGLKK